MSPTRLLTGTCFSRSVLCVQDVENGNTLSVATYSLHSPVDAYTLVSGPRTLLRVSALPRVHSSLALRAPSVGLRDGLRVVT